MTKQSNSNVLKDHAETIFRAGLARVNSRLLLEQVLSLNGDTLTIKTEADELSINLTHFRKIKLIGVGKAAAQMASGLCAILDSKIVEGIIVVKDPTEAKLPAGVEVIVGSHPIPNEQSEYAGKKLLEFCQSCGPNELVLGVISGGASALAELPAEGLTLDDLRKTTQVLMASGVTIHEMNCIRKHISQIKGGRLAREIFPAASVNFILSDVMGDDLAVIGSGPTVADKTTFADALKIIEKYKLTSKLPASVITHIKEAKDETPKVGDFNLSGTRNILVGTNRQALAAARKKAQELGYETLILSHEIQGEASMVAHKFYNFSKELEKNPKMKKPACVLAGGETTVTLQGTGKGGRNQEMALAYVCCLMDQPDHSLNQIFLSASTDGSDGPTDATGAFASMEILKSAQKLSLDPEAFLDNNDSYHFFEKAGGHLKTGTTETNVCDLQVLLIGGE
jgi:hydroxypyruvate reductase